MSKNEAPEIGIREDQAILEEDEIIVKSCEIQSISLKTICELFANPNSQEIITLLVEDDDSKFNDPDGMYLNEIAIKLKIQVSLVVYHLKKLGEMGFLTKTVKPISRRTKDHTFYKIKIDAFAVILRKNKFNKRIVIK